MAAGKPDITHLEELVAQGCLDQALEGYLKLLAHRPGDPLLRARVEMLKETLVARGEPTGPSGQEPRSPFLVTQEEVADSYVLAGRYDDALVIVEKLLKDRPADRALLDRFERIQRLRDASNPALAARRTGDFSEITLPQQSAPQPAPPKSPPARKDPPPPFGHPRSSSGAPAFGKPRSLGGGPSPARPGAAVHKPPSTPPAPAFGTPRSSAGLPSARPGVAPARAVRGGTDPVAAAAAATSGPGRGNAPPVISDDSLHPSTAAETTVRNQLPPTAVRQFPRPDATVISPPPVHEFSAAAIRTDAGSHDDPRDDTTGPPVSHDDSIDEFVPSDEIHSADDVVDGDGAKTLLAPPPEGLAAALAGGSRDDDLHSPVEPTLRSPPPPPASRSDKGRKGRG